MKPKYSYDDVVRIRSTTNAVTRFGERAWIVGIFTTRPVGDYFGNFPPGIVYSVEFEDGSSTEVHEDDLDLLPVGRGHSGTDHE